MAESYLGQEGAFYAERQPTDYIDWSKISSDLSKTLDAEAKRRTELKTQLDEENRLAINELQKSPQGEHKGANQFALEFADNGSQYLLQLNKLLKAGKISVRDYTIAVQNIKDGTNDTFSMLKEYQANFKDIMDRAKNGDSQALELYTSSQIEGYGDFNKSQIYIDPSTGKVSIAIKDKKIINDKEVYVMTQNPNQIATVSSLRGQLKYRYDKFNVDNATDLYVQSLGKQIEAVKAVGGYKNISDVTAKNDFYNAETDAIHAMLANPLHNSSILTESKKFTDDGKQYGFTYDKAEAERDPSKILLRLDPSSNVAMPDFESTENGKEQMEIATEWIRKQARTKYDKQTQFQEVAPRYAPEYILERGDRKRMEATALDNFNKIYWGTPKEKQAAVDAFIENSKMFNKGLIDIDLDTKPGFAIFRYDNPKLDNEKKLYDPSTKKGSSKKDWASIGGEILELSQDAVDNAVKKMKDINVETGGVRARRGGEKKVEGGDYTNEIRNYVNTNTDIVTDDPTTTANNLRSKFPNFRFQGTSSWGVTGKTDELTVIVPNKDPKKFNIDNKDQLSLLQQYLEDNMDKSVNPMGAAGTGTGELD